MFDWNRFKTGKLKVILRTKELAEDFYKECKKRGIDWMIWDYAIWEDEGIEYKYHVPSESLSWNWIKDNGQESVEWKGVNHMKELTFKEVIENIKEGEVWECTRESARVKSIRMSGEGENSIIAFDFGKLITENCAAIQGADKFKLQRKEYTFEEAFKAYEEGKEIESCVEPCKYKNGEFKANGDSAWLELRAIPLREIRGKWYIND